MDFKALYEKIVRRSTDALCSMWASGEQELQNYLKYLLEKEERLLVDPVFQATYPWESSENRMEELNALFSNDFITALDNAQPGYKFPKQQKPYTHQLLSWRALLEKRNSIVVTSGTGSGKTECFMIPVLSDLFEQAKLGITEGVGALFLYPLNALMGSQRNRMLAWTKAIGGTVRFGIYNGKTPEESINKTKQSALPEVCDRYTIRLHPPQILFTNPTMLEYMLVRQKDQKLLESSKGKLRWIILDEAHTYSGSSATEIALLIRRVLDAFGVKAEEVRFAATSATIGNDKNSKDELKRFLSELSGQNQDKIEVIGGRRILPPLPPVKISVTDIDSLAALDYEKQKVCKEIQEIQQIAISKPVLTLEEIGKKFNCSTRDNQLRIVNILTDKDQMALVPLRAHYFMRSISGLYACTNEKCSKHGEIRINSQVPTLSTRMTPLCPEEGCGFPMLELTGCPSCGARLLEGEYNEDTKIVRLQSLDKPESFEFEEIEEDNEEQNQHVTTDWKPIWLYPKKDVPEHNQSGFFTCGINKDGKKQTSGSFVEITDNNQRCPKCGMPLNTTIHYRASADFLSRLLLPTLLEETPPAKELKDRMVWDGRKIIGFTDNRQGTARSAAAVNADVERMWVRTRVFHQLAKERSNNIPCGGLTPEETEKLNAMKQFNPTLFASEIEKLENRKKMATDPNLTPSPRIKWENMEEALLQQKELSLLNRSLTNRNNLGSANDKAYVRALLFDQFARRPKRENSLETLGLVRLVYPFLEKIKTPQIAYQNNISDKEWQNFLKICIDFFIRENTYIQIDRDVQNLVMQYYRPGRIHPSYYDRPEMPGIRKPRKWPYFSQKHPQRSKLVLLLFSGFGWTGQNKITTEQEDIINKLLDHAWRAILPFMEGKDDDGYNFSLYRHASFELVTNAYICPVTHRFLDTIYKGITPNIKGYINTIDRERYHVKNDPVQIPYFPFPEGRTADGVAVQKLEVIEWAHEKFKEVKRAGLWSDIYERILLNYPIYLSGEHSAQQADGRLRFLEKEFDEGRLNLLSCSTTMEMGVDIGGVSMVIMNNVPPKTANYLQRAGRAGRRFESRSLALTFCKANPIGEEVLNDPQYTMVRNITIPIVTFTSEQIIQRHINSCLLGNFVRLCCGGMNVKEKVEDFFYASDNCSPCDNFAVWISENLENNQILEKVERICKGTSLSHHSKSGLMIRTQEILGNIREDLFRNITRINEKIEKLKGENGYTDESPAIKALKYESRHLLTDSSLKYLVEQGFLPSAGIPTGVVEFNIKNLDDIKRQMYFEGREDNVFRRDELPTHHVSRALTEYAPGKPVVLDGWVYRSAGILLKSTFQESLHFKIRICTTCGHQQLLEDDMTKPCPACGGKIFSGLHEIGGTFTEFIEPAGYAVDLYESPNRSLETPPANVWVEPLLLNMEPWAENSTSLIDLRMGDEHSKIVYYNIGEGNGYAVCTECGRTEPMNSDSTHNPIANHYRLRGGKDKNTGNSICRGNDSPYKTRLNVALAGSFNTDVVEIRIKDKNSRFSNGESLLLTFAVALKWQLCEHLGIDDDEISFGIKRYHINKQFFRSLFLYDTANGGAGYVKQLPDYFDLLIKKMKTRLHACDCNTCCTKCLLDKSSQWYINSLNRKVLLEWLNITDEISTDILKSLEHLNLHLNVEKIPLSKTLLRNTISKTPIEVRLFISGNMNQWELGNWGLSKELRRLENLGTKISFILPSWNGTGDSNSDLFIYSSIKSFADIYVGDGKNQKLGDGWVLAQLVYSQNKMITWFTKESAVLPPPNAFFEQNLKPNIIRYISESSPIKFPSIPQPVIAPDVIQADSKYHAKNMSFNKFGNFCLNTWNTDLPELKMSLVNKDVNLFYSDTYLVTPLSCMLFTNLLESLKKEWNVKIKSINLNICSIRNFKDTHDQSVFKEWYSNEDRCVFLKEMLKRIGIDIVTIIDQPYTKMEHFRYFEIESDTKCITIRPDGGIAHGWMVMPRKEFPFRGKVQDQLICYNDICKNTFIGPQKDVKLLTTLIIENT